MKNDYNKQMYADFNLMYNNLTSNAAAGLDVVEISSYLTKAYFGLVSSSYGEYEKSERARKLLSPLVKQATIDTFDDGTLKGNSKLAALPDDLMYIVYEKVRLSGNACLTDSDVKVLPVAHDDLDSVYNNPFRFPKDKVLRLDLDSKVELIANPNVGSIDEPFIISEYVIRYIKKPEPIILTQFSKYIDTTTNPPTEESDEAYEARQDKYGFISEDSLYGKKNETPCELDYVYHESIVRLAANMAYEDYKK